MGAHPQEWLCRLALVDYIVHVGALRRLLRAPLVQGMPALAPGNGHITAYVAVLCIGLTNCERTVTAAFPAPCRYVASDDKSSVASLEQAAALDPDTSAQYSFRQVSQGGDTASMRLACALHDDPHTLRSNWTSSTLTSRKPITPTPRCEQGSSKLWRTSSYSRCATRGCWASQGTSRVRWGGGGGSCTLA